jgi:hypothetical protein
VTGALRERLLTFESAPEAGEVYTNPSSAPGRPNAASKASSKAEVVTNADSQLLPSPERVETLFEEFFTNTGVTYPYIDECTVRNSYDRARRRQSVGVRRSFLCLLNAMLAFAAQVKRASLPNDRQGGYKTDPSEAEAYFHRANCLAARNATQPATLEAGECS